MVPFGARISMRMSPPGRTSISQRGLVKPRGPHHCARCFGSVHAWKTSARGASKTRLMMISWRFFSSIKLVVMILSFFDFVFRHQPRKFLNQRSPSAFVIGYILLVWQPLVSQRQMRRFAQIFNFNGHHAVRHGVVLPLPGKSQALVGDDLGVF